MSALMILLCVYLSVVAFGVFSSIWNIRRERKEKERETKSILENIGKIMLVNRPTVIFGLERKACSGGYVSNAKLLYKNQIVTIVAEADKSAKEIMTMHGYRPSTDFGISNKLYTVLYENELWYLPNYYIISSFVEALEE